MNCPICDSGDHWPIRSARDAKIERWRREEGEQAVYAWRLCRRCANAYPSHQPKLRVLQRIWLEHKSTPGYTAAELETVWARRRAGARTLAGRSFFIFAPVAPGRGRGF